MDDQGEADRVARLNAESAERRTNVGTVFLLAALVTVLLQAIGTETKMWPNVLAVVLAVLGAGLRIEGILLRRRT